jgi:hypothetical protein
MSVEPQSFVQEQRNYSSLTARPRSPEDIDITNMWALGDGRFGPFYAPPAPPAHTIITVNADGTVRTAQGPAPPLPPRSFAQPTRAPPGFFGALHPPR